MSISGNSFAYGIEMQLHGMGVCPWHHQAAALARRRADGAEHPGILIALIGWLPRPGSLFRPYTRLAVLLAQPRFILKPHFDWFASRQVAGMSLERQGEVFLNVSMTRSSWPGCCGRTDIWEKPSAARSLETVRS